MGTQFWWFFDLITVAVFALVIFLAARKGFSKMIISIIGSIVSFVIALSVSGTVAGVIYSNTIKMTAKREISRIIPEYDFVGKVREKMEGMGYKLKLKPEKLKEYLSKGKNINGELYKYAKNVNGGSLPDDELVFSEKMNDIFALIFNDMLSTKPSVSPTFVKLPDFVVSGLDYKKAGFKDYDELVSIMVSESEADDIDASRSAALIVDRYLEAPAVKVFKLASFAGLFVLLFAISKLLIVKLLESGSIPELGRAERPVGGILGIVEYAFIMIAFAALVKLLILIGNNNMTLFNEESVEAGYLFKHIYNIKLIK